MGKSSKKRKKEENLSGEQDNSNGESDLNRSHTTLSSILHTVSGVLYGSPSKTLNPSNSPTTSTPVQQCGTVEYGIHQKLDWIMEKLGSLDRLEEKVQRIESTIDKVDTRITEVEKKSVEYEKSIDFVSKKIDDFEQKCKDSEQAARRHEKLFEKLCGEMDEMKKEREEMQATMLDLRCRSMKNNLVFSGLAGESDTENIEEKIRSFIHNELGLDSNRMLFGNVHRFGRFTPGRHRPVVVKFLYHRDLISVKENAYKLRGSPFGVNEQFPPVIEERRRQLYPVVKQLKRDGHRRVKLVRDKLYVNGELFREPDHMTTTTTTSQPQRPTTPREAPNPPANRTQPRENSREGTGAQSSTPHAGRHAAPINRPDRTNNTAA